MKKNILQKRLFCGIVALILLLSITASATSFNDKTEINPVKVSVYNSNSRTIEEQFFTSEEGERLIDRLMSLKSSEESYYKDMDETLSFLVDQDIISTETSNWLTHKLDHHQKMIERLNTLPHRGLFFEVANLFSGTFFALKGEKVSSFVELNIQQLPFFNGTLSAQFSLFSKFNGNGTIFTLGFFGFKYSYGYNETNYDFPYFPVIEGSTIGYTGILIEVDITEGEYEGSYVIAIGMNVLTFWKLVE